MLDELYHPVFFKKKKITIMLVLNYVGNFSFGVFVGFCFFVFFVEPSSVGLLIKKKLTEYMFCIYVQNM